MAQMLEIQLPKPIQTVETVKTGPVLKSAAIEEPQINTDKDNQALQLCKCLNDLLNKFNEFQIKYMSEHKKGVTQLAVEIARKILAKKIAEGDYEIQAIIQEALKHSPSRKDIVVQLNPKDHEEINRLQENGQIESFNGIKFVPNSEINRADCVLESPKGIVESFVSEHLQRIEKAFAAME